MYRISRVDGGWIGEKLVFKYSFLGFHFCKVWKPFVTYYGSKSIWISRTKDLAIMSLLDKIKNEEIDGYFYN